MILVKSGFSTRASNLVVVCGCQFVVQFFLGMSLACLAGLQILVIWAFCNRVSNLFFVSGCLFFRGKSHSCVRGHLFLRPAGLRTNRHFSEQVTRSLVPAGPHLFLCWLTRTTGGPQYDGTYIHIGRHLWHSPERQDLTISPPQRRQPPRQRRLG